MKKWILIPPVNYGKFHLQKKFRVFLFITYHNLLVDGLGHAVDVPDVPLGSLPLFLLQLP